MVQGYSGTGSVSGRTTTPGADGRSSRVRIGNPFSVQVPHRLLQALGVRMRRARLGTERRQQARPEVDPFRRLLVAGADIHLGAAQRLHGYGVQGGQWVLLG
jgi:hypothetical protein